VSIFALGESGVSFVSALWPNEKMDARTEHAANHIRTFFMDFLPKRSRQTKCRFKIAADPILRKAEPFYNTVIAADKWRRDADRNPRYPRKTASSLREERILLLNLFPILLI
jgi:hypothetical protein